MALVCGAVELFCIPLHSSNMLLTSFILLRLDCIRSECVAKRKDDIELSLLLLCCCFFPIKMQTNTTRTQAKAYEATIELNE